jgi:hypothetical protein
MLFVEKSVHDLEAEKTALEAALLLHDNDPLHNASFKRGAIATIDWFLTGHHKPSERTC